MALARSTVLNGEPTVDDPAGCAPHDHVRLLGERFDVLYKMVYRFLLHRVWDAELAEELAAETFYRLARSLRRYGADAAALRAGALRIAANVANTHHRRQRLRYLLRGRLSFVRGRHGTEGAEGVTSAADEVSRVRAALRALRQQHQTVLVLRYFLDLSYAQIADVLGCREQTARARASRAVRRLRERLGVGPTAERTERMMNGDSVHECR